MQERKNGGKEMNEELILTLYAINLVVLIIAGIVLFILSIRAIKNSGKF